MVNKIMRYLFFISVILCPLFLSSCETPEGGSSLPWSRPESWENQALPAMEEQ